MWKVLIRDMASGHMCIVLVGTCDVTMACVDNLVSAMVLLMCEQRMLDGVTPLYTTSPLTFFPNYCLHIVFCVPTLSIIICPS